MILVGTAAFLDADVIAEHFTRFTRSHPDYKRFADKHICVLCPSDLTHHAAKVVCVLVCVGFLIVLILVVFLPSSFLSSPRLSSRWVSTMSLFYQV